MVIGEGDEEQAGMRPIVLRKYELGRTLGKGNFAKVKYARHVETGQSFAIKILDRKRIQSLNIDDQVRFLPACFGSCFSGGLIRVEQSHGADQEGDQHAEASQSSQRCPPV